MTTHVLTTFEDFVDVNMYPNHVDSAGKVIDFVMSREGQFKTWGQWITVDFPESYLLIKRSVAPIFCHHCENSHYMFIVQRITTREWKQGHGFQIMTDMLKEAEKLKYGLVLQSTISIASVKLAKKLGMTPTGYSDWHWC